MSNTLKGPWALCYDGVIEDAEGGTVIGFPFDSYREFTEQSEFDKAKQRAIAAAPELIDALEDAISLIILEVADGAYTEQAKKARAAINKATGRTA